MATIALVAALTAQTPRYPPAPAEPHAERFGSAIQRTMTLLATSTVEHRNPVRILFYGQSITKQVWSQLVARDIRTRFPFAELTIENRAIGGYSSEFLIQTVAHDVYGFYPDLIVFHDYGGEEDFEKIIAGIRRNTTAEILIQSDYPTWSHVEGEPDPLAAVQREAAHDRHSFEWLPDLCNRLGCEVIDVRRPWSRFLQENHLKAGELLSDGTHLNAQGNYLLAEITKRHLRYDPALARNSADSLVRTHEITGGLVWNEGRLKLEFEGNRVDAVARAGPEFHAETAEVWIDGKRPSAMPELYFITRPSDTYAVDWPAVNRVTAIKPLLAEDWTLRVLETGPGDHPWRFQVTGSKTGPDGAGTSDQRFVSQSGRVVIEPGEWGVKRAFNLRKQPTPAGFEVRWQVLPLFTDLYRVPRIADPSKEYVTTLALGLSNGKHTLELVTTDRTNPPLRAIRVYRPPLQ
ncbi:MAG: SGNH/GDSL hydrolase family protein [Candidatus Solibacter sp.]